VVQDAVHRFHTAGLPIVSHLIASDGGPAFAAKKSP
jgi:hypothetical protein